MSASAQLRRLTTPLFRHAISRATALRFAARRGRSLVLLYHRILPDGIAPDAIVPSLPVSLFRQHVEALQRIGDIVPVGELLAAHHGPRPRFALTFDDDHVGYVATVLPVLQALGAPATFFLSGRDLHGLPPYWWANVESSLRTHGVAFTRDALGVRGDSVAEIALALEQSGNPDELAGRLPSVEGPSMSAGDIAALARAGMTIGFHTLRHPVMTMQSKDELEKALEEGRRELASVTGTGVDFLAYPHGRASAAVADATERASFAAAFVTGGRPISSSSDRFLLSRWEPGPLSAEDLTTHAAMRLLRTPAPPATFRHKRLS